MPNPQKCRRCRIRLDRCTCTVEQLAEHVAQRRRDDIRDGRCKCPGCGRAHRDGRESCVPIVADLAQLPPTLARVPTQPADPYTARPHKDPGHRALVAEMRSWAVAETREARATRGTVDPLAAGYAVALLRYESHREALEHAATRDAPQAAQVEHDYSQLSDDELERLAELTDRARVR